MTPTKISEEYRCPRCDKTGQHRGLCSSCLADEMNMDDDDTGMDEGPAFECAGWNDGTGFYCPLWGSEECDWECPKGGMA